jgi:hypothetical protein
LQCYTVSFLLKGQTGVCRDHKAIQLEKGQSIIIEAVGAEYTTFEGYKTETETRIGLSYAKLCETLVPGNTILIADGTISIQVGPLTSLSLSAPLSLSLCLSFPLCVFLSLVLPGATLLAHFAVLRSRTRRDTQV